MPNVLYTHVIEVEERVTPVKGSIKNSSRLVTLANGQQVKQKNLVLNAF